MYIGNRVCESSKGYKKGSKPKPAPFIYVFWKRLTEVSLKESLECSAVASLVLCHLVNGVMDCVEVLAKPAFAKKVCTTSFFR